MLVTPDSQGSATKRQRNTTTFVERESELVEEAPGIEIPDTGRVCMQRDEKGLCVRVRVRVCVCGVRLMSTLQSLSLQSCASFKAECLPGRNSEKSVS